MEGSQATYTPLSGTRIAAKIAWLLSTFFTALFLNQIAPSTPWYTLVPLSLIIQYLFTKIERPFWRSLYRRKDGKVLFYGLMVTLIDGGINAGGVYPYIPRLIDTNVGIMFTNALGLTPTMPAMAHLILSWIIGTLAAGAYEYLEEAQ